MPALSDSFCRRGFTDTPGAACGVRAGMARRLAFVMAALLALLLCGPLQAAPIPPGSGHQVADLGGVRLTIYTYRPQCADPTILLVFHGLNRNADRYRDHARSLGDRLCMLVVAPKFDKERFPTWRYQRGGIVDRHGVVQPPERWTGRLVLQLVAWLRTQEGRPLAYSMIGHSAGGQFLSRVAAFIPNEARRMVVANPSTWVFPSVGVDAPYGLRRAYSRGEADARLRRYLAAPVTVFLGQEDEGDRNRNDSDEAVAQGETRHDRGLNVFAAARKAAQTTGAPLNWRLVELPGVGHSASKMFSSREALDALAP
jgi:pimeloyl-ACP methyl ester carboxylesterase